MSDLPSLTLGKPGDDGESEMRRHIEEAVAAHAQKIPRKAANALAAAETAARKANLTRHAAKIRKAIVLLAQGQTPRLLTRPNYLDHERE
jgi:hypothetical protein